MDQNTVEQLFKLIEAYEQTHLLADLADLETPEQEQEYLQKLASIDYELMNKLYQNLVLNPNFQADTNEGDITQIPHKITYEQLQESRPQLENIGLKAIAEGKVAVLLMSGGQGSRLGFNEAKGKYDIGLPSNRTIFEIFAGKFKRLSNYAKETHPQHVKSFGKDLVHWYVMTSDATDSNIRDYFQENKNFGLTSSTVNFFKQDSLPALDLQTGKIILEDKNKLFDAPNGNGGLFKGLVDSGSLAKMREDGVEYVHIVGVDNVLLRVADPVQVGYAIHQGFQIAAKYVKKAYANEKVGVFCLRNDKFDVVEYSDITPEVRDEVDQNGELIISEGNIANFLVRIDFLEQIGSLDNYHVAKKKVPFYNSETQKIVEKESLKTENAVKFELFMFDVLPEAHSFGCLEVLREDEFAPVKNKNNYNEVDCPDTARTLYSNLCQKWLLEAGFRFNQEANGDKDNLCEISPLITYAGENLSKYRPVYMEENEATQLPYTLEVEKNITQSSQYQVIEETVQRYHQYNFPQIQQSNQVQYSSTQNQKQTSTNTNQYISSTPTNVKYSSIGGHQHQFAFVNRSPYGSQIQTQQIQNRSPQAHSSQIQTQQIQTAQQQQRMVIQQQPQSQSFVQQRVAQGQTYVNSPQRVQQVQQVQYVQPQQNKQSMIIPQQQIQQQQIIRTQPQVFQQQQQRPIQQQQQIPVQYMQQQASQQIIRQAPYQQQQQQPQKLYVPQQSHQVIRQQPTYIPQQQTQQSVRSIVPLPTSQVPVVNSLPETQSQQPDNGIFKRIFG